MKKLNLSLNKFNNIVFIFLYGLDIYRSHQKLNEIIEHYQKTGKSGFSLKYFNLRNSVFQDFIDEIQQVSIFNEKKLIILTNIFQNTEFKKSFLTEVEKIVNIDNIILFYEEKEVSAKDPFFVFLKRQGKCQEFKLLDRQKLENWIKKEFFAHNTEISQKAVQALINSVGNNLWQLSNEIKKLVSYTNEQSERSVADERESFIEHKRGKNFVCVEDVNLLVRQKIETDIFKTIEAMAVKNKKQALTLLHKHLEKGDNPLYLLSMISFQFRNLLIVKDLIQKNLPYNLLVKEAKLHPFVVRKTYPQAQKFTLQELKKIYQKIFQIDLKIKTGQIESQLALDLFIAESC